MPDEISSILMGLILGNKNYLSQDTKDNFTNSSLAHLLVVSGAHISYLILGISILFSKLKFSKKSSYFLSMLVLIFFSSMVGWTPSVIRASIAGVLALFAKMIYRKSDIYTNLSISSLIILFINPYSIWDIGFLLSYFATIGIIFFYPILISFFNKKTKKFKFIKECTAISTSAQIFILPISSYFFNKFSFNFIISNILATPLFIFAVLYGFFVLIIGNIFNELGQILSWPLNLDLKALIFVSEIMSKNEWANLPVTRPNVVIIFIYYLIFLFIKFIYNINSKNKQKDLLTGLEKIEIKTINYLKLKKEKIKNIILILFFILIIIKIIFSIIPQNLKINFVDVGQGDCTLIQTAYNKKILIDGGGSKDVNYDVGEKVLIPYLLNKNIKNLDYILISHFDSDHVGGLLTVMEKLKVKNAIIPKQIENSENYEKFKNIVKEKKIKVIIVDANYEDIKIEKNTKIQILWPEEQQIKENVLNNNSLVCKLCYKKFTMLFTGDIEEIAEKQILLKYKNFNILNADILKVAHHGSKTSSTQKFIEGVRPKIALIGVGKNNLFGHPNSEVIKRLEKIGAIVYRTDEMGEISVVVNKNGGMKINTNIK